MFTKGVNMDWVVFTLYQLSRENFNVLITI